jgi:hypothetical protein
MNIPKLHAIAKEIGDLYTQRTGYSLLEWQAEQDIERRKVELAPADGWPGKNEEQRKLAAEKTFQADETYQKAWADARAARNALTQLEGKIAALEAERRALEWEIRAQLVIALTNSHVQRSGGEVSDTAFGDVMDSQADQILFEIPELDF